MENFKATPADFDSAMELKDAIGKELSKNDVKIDVGSLTKIMDADVDIMGLLSIAAKLDSSADVRNAVFKCLVRCTYKDEKITKELFDDVNMRSLYYPMVLECIKVNLTPFFGEVISKLSGSGIAASLTAKIKDDLK